MQYLSLEEVLILHEYQIEKFGGSSGIRDVALLESAILRPQTTFDGKDLYDDLYKKAAVAVHSIVKNHPFVDGNKRTGLHAAISFLELNGKEINISTKNLVKLGLDITNNNLTIEKIAKILKKSSK